jgi:hypothetical protein
MPQDQYFEDEQQVQDPRRRILARSRFGEKDRTQFAPMEENLGNVVEGLILGRRREIERRSAELEDQYIGRNLQGLEQTFRSGKRNRITGQLEPMGIQDINSAIDQTQLKLLQHGGEKTRQAASDIQKLRKVEKMDVTNTLEEALLSGRMTIEKYREAKQAGQTGKKEAYLLEAGRKVKGRTGGWEFADVYGYKDEKGNEVVTDMKRPTFEPKAGGAGGVKSNALKALEAKKNALQRRLYPLTQKGVNLDEVILTGADFGEDDKYPVIKTRDGNEIELTPSQAKDIKVWLDALNAYEERAAVEETPVNSAVGIAAGREGRGRTEKPKAEKIPGASTTASGGRYSFKKK